MEAGLLRSCLVTLLLIAFCASSTLALDSGERRSKSIEPQESSSQSQRIRQVRRLSSRDDELGGSSTEKQSLSTEDADDSEESEDSGDGLLLSSAGNGNERKSSTKSLNTSTDDDDKKTLSQQVKEGKYGLIQNEIYPEQPKRPGIISYSANPEVPRDTASNLGGLDEKEIWLAENHVLVLKGGNFPDSDGPITDNDWPPIDDYEAPQRQVKIPPRPKVPPPFPVQLVEGGPIQLIGTNSSSLVENGTIDFESLPGGFKGFLPGEGPYFPLPGAANSSGGPPEKKNKADGPPGPFYPALPPGAVIVPPPSNQTDYDDEDQSIYYPPPYSFVYPQDNSTAIPPGPLVPGIILPPPPDFFSTLEEKKPATKDKLLGFAKRPTLSTTPVPGRPSYLPPPRKSSTKLYKTASVTSTPVGSKTVSYNPKPFGRSKLKNSTTYQTEKTTPPRVGYQTFVEVTSPPPVESTSLESPPQEKYRHFKPIVANQLPVESSTEKPWRVNGIANRPVSLLTFYASTTPNSVDEPVETTPASIQNVLTTENPAAARFPGQASYYFYEEANAPSSEASGQAPSSTADPLVFFGTTAETPPYYKLEQRPQPEDEKKAYYDVEMIPSRQTSKDYNVKLIDSIVKDPQIFRYLDSGATNSHEKYETQPARSQSPRMLHSEPIFYQPAPTRSPPKLSYFSSTARPKSYYREPSETNFSPKPTSKPIYQYSFEATNYSKRGSHAISPKPEIAEVPEPVAQRPQQSRRHKELPVYQEYQDIQTVSDQYDYESSEAVADQKLRTEKLPYLAGKSKERSYYPQHQNHQHQSTTVSPVRDTTLAAHQQYFTKQDEQLLDDVTKEYFTMFGKKLSSGKLPSTTPIYGKSSVTERPKYTSANSFNSPQPDYGGARQFRPPNIKVHYGDQTPGPYSLKDDVLVNYNHPLPNIDPDSEFIPVVNPSPRPSTVKYRPRPVLQVASQLRDFSLQPLVGNARQRFDQLRGYGAQRTDQQHQQQQQQVPQRNTFVPVADPREAVRGYPAQRPIALESDMAVNYKNPRPAINPDAEFIPARADGNADKPNSYFAYRLPGDGGHFYFLTPQAISRDDPNGRYLYSRSRGSRLLRRRRGRDAD